MLKVVRPVVVGLLVWTAYDRDVLFVGWDKLLIILVVFGLLTFSKINPAFVILAGAILGGVLYR